METRSSRRSCWGNGWTAAWLKEACWWPCRRAPVAATTPWLPRWWRSGWTDTARSAPVPLCLMVRKRRTRTSEKTGIDWAFGERTLMSTFIFTFSPESCNNACVPWSVWWKQSCSIMHRLDYRSRESTVHLFCLPVYRFPLICGKVIYLHPGNIEKVGKIYLRKFQSSARW